MPPINVSFSPTKVWEQSVLLCISLFFHVSIMFQSSDKFEMTSSRSEIYAMNKNKFFTLQISTAFILTLLSLVIAIGVGLIVHFAGGNKTVVCQCSCGDGSNSDGQVGCPEQTTQDVACKY